MADIFISYAREDRDTAQSLAKALEQADCSVWWDREIPGGTDFTRVLTENLAAARRVVVLWSERSVASTFVRDESARARDAGKLLPVRIDDVELPLGFGQIHTLDLLDWDGDAKDPACQAVIAEVRHALQGGQRPLSNEPPRRWRLRSRVWAMLPLVIVGAVYVVWQWKPMDHEREDKARADQYFQDGLRAQFASEPNLESARNYYLMVLQTWPQYAGACYYLGHVYAQLRLLKEAHDSFQKAISIGTGLDTAQMNDARRQLTALTMADEPAPLARSLSSVPVGASPAPAPNEGRIEPAASAGGVSGGAQVTGTGLEFKLPPSAGVKKLGGLPDIAPDDKRVSQLEPLVGQMFAPLRDDRISATTSLIVDAAAISDAVAMALPRAIRVQETPPPDQASQAAARSGVINTLLLLQAASPATLRKHADDVERLIAMVRPNGPQTTKLADAVAQRLDAVRKTPPIVWIQISDEAQRPLAERLAAHLRQAGYDAPGIEKVGAKAPATKTEIRVHGNSDQGLLRWITQGMANVDGLTPNVTVLRKTAPKVDTFEIWFDQQICVSRRVAACS